MKKGLVSPLSILIGGVIGSITGASIVHKVETKKTNNQNKYAEKHLQLYLLMNQWVKNKQNNKTIAKYLEDEGYREIAVYGLHYVGETLINELADSYINVAYAIDKNADSIYTDIKVYSPNELLPEVDAVIVTPITFYDEIENMLTDKLNCPIISLEDIVYEL